MGRRTFIVGLSMVAVLGAVSACSLLSLGDDYTSGSAPDGAAVVDASVDSSVPVDASIADAPVGDVPGDDGAKSAAYRAAVMADGPLGYWRFEETSGSVIRDETGGSDGQLQSSPTLGATGVAGSRGMRFPANDRSRMFVPSTKFGFEGRKAFSIEVWVRPAIFKQYQWIATTETGATFRTGWSLLGYGDGVIGYEGYNMIDGGEGPVVRGFSTDGPVALDRYQHIVVTYDGTVVGYYLDGVRVGGGNDTSPLAPSGSLWVGCTPQGSAFTDCLEGWSLDELALYDFALAASRVSAHFDAGK